ncbi:hypothetical protein RF11_13675 [Thelohanellus kitauei]|uniref:Uncharacterized protein n=1 Tax=Thelohanellus kitauei TaxID=669202 RepID=A0A0C2MKU1_THEKT|nr:hypothetical protein RF11_13675 [Thelohanellus kitauei]
MDEGCEFKFTPQDALHVAWHHWEQVGKSTIRNGFANAKFIEGEIQTQASIRSCSRSCKLCLPKKNMHEKSEIELSNFIEAGEHLTTGEYFTLEEIQARSCAVGSW